MIRVLHVVNIMDFGGLETFIMNVYRNIDREKIQFDFLVHEKTKGAYDEEILSLGGKIYYVKPRNKGIYKNKKSLDHFFRCHNYYKIVHAHLSSLSYVEPIKYAKKYGIPVRVIQSHSTKEGGSFIHTYIHKFNRKFVKHIATDYFGCSDLANKWMFGDEMLKQGECKLICNGIEIEKFIYNKNIAFKMRSELNIDDKFVVGHIGRFAYPKNHDFILDVFNSIYKKNNNAVLVLVGDGELKKDIENKICKLGLQNSVILTGMRTDVDKLLQAMDVFLFPSHYEGLPVTLVEAQVSGLKCFVSDNITRQVKITKNINYLELGDAEYWAETILSNKDYIRESMLLQVKKTDFDIENVVKTLEKFYLKKV